MNLWPGNQTCNCSRRASIVSGRESKTTLHTHREREREREGGRGVREGGREGERESHTMWISDVVCWELPFFFSQFEFHSNVAMRLSVNKSGYTTHTYTYMYILYMLVHVHVHIHTAFTCTHAYTHSCTSTHIHILTHKIDTYDLAP